MLNQIKRYTHHSIPEAAFRTLTEQKSKAFGNGWYIMQDGEPITFIAWESLSNAAHKLYFALEKPNGIERQEARMMWEAE